MELFTIQCTTCRARLVVHDESVIGDILACPKCGSMVHVVPPAGWGATTVEVAPQNPAAWPPTRQPTTTKPAQARETAESPPPAKAKAAAVIPPALPPRPAPAPPPVIAAKVVGQPPLPAVAAGAAVVPPPVPSALATENSIAMGSMASKNAIPTRPAATRWTKLANWARQEWKFLAGGVGAGIALGGTVWLVLALQAPSSPIVAELQSESAPPAVTAVEPAPVAAAPPAGETPVAAAAAGEESSASHNLPTDQPHKPAGEPNAPSPTAPPIAAKPADKPDAAGSDQADVQPAANDEKALPVASTPRPTIKLEPAPAAGAAVTQSAESASTIDKSIIDSGAGEADDAPAAVRTPAGDSPGAERPALTAAEVDERLSRSVPAAQFNRVPLGQFVEFVAEFTSLQIQLDEPALKRAGKSRQSAVTIKLNETTAGDALRAALSDLGLVTSLRAGRLVVTTAPDGKSDK